MDKHHFQLTFKEDVARKLNKKAYKAATSYLRLCRRKMEEYTDFDQVAVQVIHDLTLYGTSVTMF